LLVVAELDGHSSDHHFPFIFQLRPGQNVKNAAIPAFLEFYCKLPKLPLATLNSLERRHLVETQFSVIGKWWKTEGIPVQLFELYT
jgi:hypothetical protein